MRMQVWCHLDIYENVVAVVWDNNIVVEAYVASAVPPTQLQLDNVLPYVHTDPFGARKYRAQWKWKWRSAFVKLLVLLPLASCRKENMCP